MSQKMWIKRQNIVSKATHRLPVDAEATPFVLDDAPAVLVASCPAKHIDGVRAEAKSNRNVMLGYSTKEDYRPGQVTKAMGAIKKS